TPITGDNLYLKYAVEMGIAGIGLLVAIFVVIGRAALRLYRDARDDASRRIGLMMLLATIGMAMNGMTAALFNSPPIAWIYFWAAGATVTLLQRTATMRVQPHRAPAK